MGHAQDLARINTESDDAVTVLGEPIYGRILTVTGLNHPIRGEVCSWTLKPMASTAWGACQPLYERLTKYLI